MSVGIVMAMAEELVPYVNKTGAKPVGSIGRRNIFTTKIANENVAFVLAGIGRANASRATASLIDLGCRAIFNIGTCGCTYKEPCCPVGGTAFIPSIGEVWIPSVFLDGDYDLSQFGNKTKDPVGLFSEKDLEGKLKSAPRIFTVSHFATEPIDEGGYLVDMEAYDCLSVCDALSVPFMSIKVISDCANEHATGDFNQHLKTVINDSLDKVLSYVVKTINILNHNDEPAKPQPKVRVTGVKNEQDAKPEA